MPLLMRFLVSYANRSNCFSSHIFGELDLSPGSLVGRAIALLGVGNTPSGDRISTAHFTPRLADAVPFCPKIHCPLVSA